MTQEEYTLQRLAILETLVIGMSNVMRTASPAIDRTIGELIANAAVAQQQLTTNSQADADKERDAEIADANSEQGIRTMLRRRLEEKQQKDAALRAKVAEMMGKIK